MRVNGEYLFGSFEEACAFVCNPTNYEKEHNIRILGKSVILDTPDLKLVEIQKSDNQCGLTIFFKNSTKYDIWKFWQPSGAQQKVLPTIAEMLLKADDKNRPYWKTAAPIIEEYIDLDGDHHGS